MIKKVINTLTISVIILMAGYGQNDTLHLSIESAIEMAEEQSLAAFRNKNMYLTGYWAYRNYVGQFLPSLNFASNLVDYIQGISREYNRGKGTYDYVPVDNMTTSLGLNIAQNVAFTGGVFKINYNSNRLDNFVGEPYHQFSSTPFSITYQQKIFGYNSFKWQKKLSPLEFEKAKKDYLYQSELMKRNVVIYFFRLAEARNNLEIARQKLEKAKFRYRFGQRKYDLGTMSKVNLLDLEVSLKNAEVEYNKQVILEEQALMNFNRFLNFPSDTQVILQYDFNVPDIMLEPRDIMDRSHANNPDMLEYKLNLLNAESQMEKAKREKGFSFDLNMGYGLSKVVDNSSVAGLDFDNMAKMFTSPFERYSQLKVGINIPIVDWGQRRGTYYIKRAEYQIAESQYKQDLDNFNQQILILVKQFNLLPANIESAAISDRAAQQSFKIYDKYFREGEADLIKLLNSIEQRDKARKNYLNTLYDYWYSYYNMRALTLYDFVKDTDIQADFDKLIGR